MNRDDKFRAKVRALWATGDSCLTIAGKLGVTKGVITGLAFRMKLPIRPHPPRTIVSRGDLVASRAKKPTVALLKPAHREIQAMHPVNDNGRARKMGPLTIGFAEHTHPVARGQLLPRQSLGGGRGGGFRKREEGELNEPHDFNQSMTRGDTKIRETPPPPTIRAITSRHECQFPTTMPNGKHKLLCEAMATNGPYCVEHRALCWVPTKAQRQARQ